MKTQHDLCRDAMIEAAFIGGRAAMMDICLLILDEAEDLPKARFMLSELKSRFTETQLSILSLRDQFVFREPPEDPDS